jgi:hypothetical protein
MTDNSGLKGREEEDAGRKKGRIPTIVTKSITAGHELKIMARREKRDNAGTH